MTQSHKAPIDLLVTWWKYEKNGTMRSLAKALDVTPATIYYWIHGSQIPVKRLKRIEQITDNAFTKEMMRPDLFD